MLYNLKEANIVLDAAENGLDTIVGLGFDYDGLHTAEDLKGLIDDIVAIARSYRKICHDRDAVEVVKQEIKAFPESKDVQQHTTRLLKELLEERK